MTGPDALPIVIAHRGASGYRPEHTRAAYELAIDLGADAIEPDIVASKDGVLVLRHENDISATTDVAKHPEFAARRTTKSIDGARLTGWFTEDFTWEELRTLRARERLAGIRPANTEHPEQPLLRLADLIHLLDAADRSVGLVAELKHASYFEAIGLPLDRLLADELRAAGWADDPRLTVESFETTVLGRLRDRGLNRDAVFLLEADGSPADGAETDGVAMQYSDYLTDSGLAAVAGTVDGISVNKQLLLRTDAAGNAIGVTDLVDRAHAAGLSVFGWTLRAENRFLPRNFRRGASRNAFGDWMAEFQLIMHSGVDGVFADQPDLALRARAEL